MNPCFVQVTNVTRNLPVADQATVATAILERMIGLLSRESLKAGEGMVFPHCRAIHTFGMRFPIDVVFLKQESVVKVVSALGPGRTAAAAGADTVIELPSGAAALTGIELGDKIRWNAAEKGLTGSNLVG